VRKQKACISHLIKGELGDFLCRAKSPMLPLAKKGTEKCEGRKEATDIISAALR
jgi:hypothetical protein